MLGRQRAGDLDDERLIARIATRDRAAFDEFYRTHARRILAFVRDVVGSAELAEEVASDALVAVWQSAPRFDGRSRVTTWVLAIAHHKAVDALRRRRVDHVMLSEVTERAGPSPDPVDALLRGEERAELDRALMALSAQHRTVLGLMFGFGCSQAEIAAIVGCPLATVKTRAFYAKRRLREELDRHAAEELA